jgi:hypothetical protein
MGLRNGCEGWVEDMMCLMMMCLGCVRGAGVWVERESSSPAQVFGGDQQTGVLQHAGNVAVVAARVEHIEVGVVQSRGLDRCGGKILVVGAGSRRGW